MMMRNEMTIHGGGHCLPAAHMARPERAVAWADLLPSCARRRYSPGFAAYGGNMPPRVSGGYFPGEDAGFYCSLTLEPCSDYPPDCPEWKETTLVCPACIEFKTRQPRRAFAEHALLGREGKLYCPECHETYDSELAVALAAINSLRDALDDAAYLDGLVRGVEETFGVSR